MKKLLLTSTFSKIILKVEITEWYKINLGKEHWRKFNIYDISNMFSIINFGHGTFAIKLANILLEKGIYCRVLYDNTYSIQLASYWGMGNILFVPVLKNDKYYLYFIVHH